MAEAGRGYNLLRGMADIVITCHVVSTHTMECLLHYIIHTCTYNVTMASPVMGHHQVQAHVRNFLLLEGAAETAPDAEGIKSLDVLLMN